MTNLQNPLHRRRGIVIWDISLILFSDLAYSRSSKSLWVYELNQELPLAHKMRMRSVDDDSG